MMDCLTAEAIGEPQCAEHVSRLGAMKGKVCNCTGGVWGDDGFAVPGAVPRPASQAADAGQQRTGTTADEVFDFGGHVSMSSAFQVS